MVGWHPCVPTQEEPDWEEIYLEVKRVVPFTKITLEELKNKMKITERSEREEHDSSWQLYTIIIGDNLVAVKWYNHGKYAAVKAFDIG